jgi:hypothetical protein
VSGILHEAARIDFSVAKRSCRHCHGRGYTGWVTLPDGGRARLLCRCVVRNGGVPPPQPAAPLVTGIPRTPEQNVAEQIKQLSPAQQRETVKRLHTALADHTASSLHRARIRAVLAILGHKEIL